MIASTLHPTPSYEPVMNLLQTCKVLTRIHTIPYIIFIDFPLAVVWCCFLEKDNLMKLYFLAAAEGCEPVVFDVSQDSIALSNHIDRYFGTRILFSG